MINSNSKIKVLLNLDHKPSSAEQKHMKSDLASYYKVDENQISLKFNLPKEKQKFKSLAHNIEESIKSGNTDYYSEYLKLNYDDYDYDSFKKLDERVSKEIKDANTTSFKQRFKVKHIQGKNILSFGEFFHVFDDKGLILIQSEPGNEAGKTNFFRLIKFLIWGKYNYGEKTTKLDMMFNAYRKHEKHAYIEGELTTSENKTYYLRRDLVINSGDKVSHKFTIVEKKSKGEADTYLFHSDDLTKVYLVPKNEVSRHQENAMGFYCNNLKGKNAKLSLQQFENVIGTLDDFYFSSYLDESSVKKWLRKKATERTNLFYDYFGLKIFQEKLDIAKKMYKDFLKNSDVKKYSIADIKTKIKNIQLEHSKNEDLLKSYIEQINNLQDQINQYTSKIEELYKNRHTIDNQVTELPDMTVLQETKRTHELERDKLISVTAEIDEIDINWLNTQLSNLKSKRNNLNRSTYVNEINQLKEQIKQIDKTKIESIKNEKQKFKLKFLNNNTQIANLQTELSNLGDNQVCDFCGKVISNTESKKQAINSEIKKLEEAQLIVISKGKKLKEQLITEQNKLDVIESNLKMSKTKLLNMTN
jgi:DNA repair exonuclease SbcCD ATPase subunit